MPGFSLTHVHISCFVASYAVALLLELARLLLRTQARILGTLGFTAAGILAQTIYIVLRSTPDPQQAPPLSSWFDWLLLVAWGVAVAYLIQMIRRPQAAAGIFMLPLVLVLIGVASLFRHAEPFPRDQAMHVWGMVHGMALLLGSVVVMLGFIAGVMYLVQSRRLKKKLPPPRGLKLPSLEWLQQSTKHALLLSSWLLAAGLLSGVILNLLQGRNRMPWTDPVVWTSGILFVWLVVVLVFEAVYKPAQQGRKVAYLTLASFRFPGTGPGHRVAGPVAPRQPAVQRISAVRRSTRRPTVPWSRVMKFQLVGCSHHTAPIEIRERLAFAGDQTQTALADLRQRFPAAESVLVSTCNRVEVYTAAEDPEFCPTHHQLVDFLAGFHRLDAMEIFDALFERTGEDAVRHLFMVASSLDSMVVGEAQILSQVKQAYELARATNNAGPLTNAAFQAAMRVAKRVASETAINQRRVSIPSVAVADFAKAIFERFEDKRVLVIGAGEMGEETVRYLIDEGVREITVVNRHPRAGPGFGRTHRGGGSAVGRSAPIAGRGRSGDLDHGRGGADPDRRAHFEPSTRPAISGRCFCWIWPCPAISNRRWAISWACTCTRSTT